MSFLIVSVLFGGVGFFLFSDTINVILQLKFCIEEEYRNRIASAFFKKKKQV